MDQTSVTRVSYAGPTTCLRCDGSLVIDTAFSIETGDPGHTYDPTGNMIAKALY